MRLFMLAALLFASFDLFAEDSVRAEPELLGRIALGDNGSQIQYGLTVEGYQTPGGPFVDGKGNLILNPDLATKEVVFTSGSFRFQDFDESFPPENRNHALSPAVSQQGSWGYVPDFFTPVWAYRGTLAGLGRTWPADMIGTPMPWGFVFSSEKTKEFYSVETSNVDGAIVRNLRDTALWLQGQTGGFTVGIDGHLYRNGILWSATQAPILDGVVYSYLGRLMSGHVLWDGGGYEGSPEKLVVTRPDGTIELLVQIPWMANYTDTHYRYDYGVGPWGEMYGLLPPSFLQDGYLLSPDASKNPRFVPNPTKPAELVVVRNYLSFFGRLNDSGVRLRKEPTTSGEILGTYPIKTGFRILQKGLKEETVAGLKNFWYRVRLLDGKEGWFFGSFVRNLFDGPNGKAPPWPNQPDW